MPTEKYLDTTGLQYYHNRIKTIFASQADLDTLDAKVDDIITQGGEPNVIEVVQKNGTALPVTNKTVNVTVPVSTSELTNNGDGTSNFATEQYVDTNGGKIDTISVNNVQQTITNKNVNITVPTKTSEITNDSDFVSDANYVHTDNNFTNALKTKLEGVEADAEVNIIEVVKQNGTALTVDGADRSVNVTVPTTTSQLTNNGDGTSNFATEAYVQTNGGKIDTISVNGTQQTITNKNVDITVPTKTSDLTNDSNFVSDADYVHTDNNFTTTLKDKLDGIAAGAEVNVQANWTETDNTSDAFILNKPAIPTKTSDLTNDGDGTSNFATENYVDTEISTAISSVYRYKGSVATVQDLPASGNTTGDVYDVQENGVNYAWNGTAWDALGALVDMSLYWAKSELQAMTTAEIDAIINPPTP